MINVKANFSSKYGDISCDLCNLDTIDENEQQVVIQLSKIVLNYVATLISNILTYL